MGLLVYLLSQERGRYETNKQADRCAGREGINCVIKQWCPKFNLKKGDRNTGYSISQVLRFS
jgi:hypothetical protein